jgi:ubiquinone/menaquinone biosynthesis C-methylase UbiE
MEQEPAPEGYVSALRFRWLTRIYDPVVRLTTREQAFKRALLAQSSLRSAAKILDLGCGTGTLAVMAEREASGAAISAVDGDREILERARAKAAESGAEIEFSYGLADDLPYPDRGFDRVLSTLLFHHLADEGKLQAAREIARVLAPGGELHLADWGAAQDPLMRTAFLPVQLLDGFETTAANVAGRLPAILEQGGLGEVQVRRRMRTPLGTIELISAKAPH